MIKKKVVLLTIVVLVPLLFFGVRYNTTIKNLNTIENVSQNHIKSEQNKNNDDLILQKESEHFIFYCSDKDTDTLDSLSDILENKYEKNNK